MTMSVNISTSYLFALIKLEFFDNSIWKARINKETHISVTFWMLW